MASLASQPGEELTATDIASGPGGVVIVGESFRPTPARPDLVDGFIATSPDGRSWHRVDDAAAGLDNGGQLALRRVVADGNSFLAIGTRTRAGHADVASWRPAGDGAGPGGQLGTGTWNVVEVSTATLVLGTALTVDRGVAAAAAIDDGKVRIWWERLDGRWEEVRAPRVSSAQGVLLAAADGRVVVAIQTARGAMLWRRRFS